MDHRSLEKTVVVNGVEVRLRASALIPRLYRIKFGRDVVVDMSRLQKSVQRVTDDETGTESLDVMDLTIFEDIAYMMAKHADPGIPEDPAQWLDELPGVFSIYSIFPEILDMWGMNQVTTAIPAKK